MEALEYRSAGTTRDDVRRQTRALAPLVMVPAASLVVTWLLFLHMAHGEPFMVFSWDEVVIFGGGLLLVIGLWAAWFWLAIRRRRLAWPIVALVACWAAGNVWVAQWLLVAYLREPWRD